MMKYKIDFLDTGFMHEVIPAINFTFNGKPRVTMHSDGSSTKIVDNFEVRKQYLISWNIISSSGEIHWIYTDNIIAPPKQSMNYRHTYAEFFCDWFIELKEFRPEENIIPQNPAIWETEPKVPETDLDIYHAVGGFHTINIPDITEFIPVGSIIQHENSNAIPPNTTITSVDANCEIHLSETITIDPITRTNTGDGSEPNWGAQIE